MENNKYEKYFNIKYLSDITLVNKSSDNDVREYYCHKLVLSANSEYFESILKSNEKTDKLILPYGIKPYFSKPGIEIDSIILKYFYYDTITIDKLTADGLNYGNCFYYYSSASKLKFEKVKNIIKTYILSNITNINGINCLYEGINFNEKEWVQLGFKYVVDNLETVLNDKNNYKFIVDLPFNKFYDLINSDELNISSEDIILELIIEYIKEREHLLTEEEYIKEKNELKNKEEDTKKEDKIIENDSYSKENKINDKENNDNNTTDPKNNETENDENKIDIDNNIKNDDTNKEKENSENKIDVENKDNEEKENKDKDADNNSKKDDNNNKANLENKNNKHKEDNNNKNEKKNIVNNNNNNTNNSKEKEENDYYKENIDSKEIFKKHKLTFDQKNKLILAIRFLYISHKTLLNYSKSPLLSDFKEILLEALSAKLKVYENIELNYSIILKPRNKYEIKDTINKNSFIADALNDNNITKSVIKEIKPNEENDKTVINDNSVKLEADFKTDFVYDFNFDKNGLLYYLGTEGYNKNYENPYDSNKVKVVFSSLGNGCYSDFVGRSLQNCRTLNEKNAYMALDLGKNAFLPFAYTIRNRNSIKHVMINWVFEASNDFKDWVILDKRMHLTNDKGFNEMMAEERNKLICKGAMNTFNINTGIYKLDNTISNNASNIINTNGYRYFRIRQITENSSGSYNLALSGIELYGKSYKKIVFN